jgi:hypothetical protein
MLMPIRFDLRQNVIVFPTDSHCGIFTTIHPALSLLVLNEWIRPSRPPYFKTNLCGCNIYYLAK